MRASTYAVTQSRTAETLNKEAPQMGWHRLMDLNHHPRSQSPVCCHYTNAAYVGRIAPR